MNSLFRWSFTVLFAVSAYAGAQSSPYAGQESREIKALSGDEVAALLAGEGSGLAKAAELNGYPGPLHVLQIASALHLSDQQRTQTAALFDTMQAKAKAIGKKLVDEERRLDLMFRDRTISREALSAALAEIGTMQAELRAAHLEAHLAQGQILNSEQVAEYIRLRGYASETQHGGGHTRPRH